MQLFSDLRTDAVSDSPDRIQDNWRLPLDGNLSVLQGPARRVDSVQTDALNPFVRVVGSTATTDASSSSAAADDTQKLVEQDADSSIWQDVSESVKQIQENWKLPLQGNLAVLTGGLS